MITLRYEQLTDRDFQSAIHKLSTTPANNRAACRIVKITKPIIKAVEKMEKEFRETVLSTYGERDEKGELKVGPQGYSIQKDKREEFTKAQADFGQNEITIDWEKLNHNDIAHINFSPAEMDALLETVFTEVEPTSEKVTKLPSRR